MSIDDILDDAVESSETTGSENEDESTKQESSDTSSAKNVDPEKGTAEEEASTKTENSSKELAVRKPQASLVRFQVGSKVGQFIILRLISIDGLCQTYLVRHTVTNKKEVIKLLPKELNDDPKFIERFNSVSEKIQKLIHPNILNERRLEVRGEDHFIIEDYISNKTGNTTTLEDELSSGRKYTDNEAKDLALQICKALESAYKYKNLKCVHKDFKPSHILIDSKNKIHIAHFCLVPLVGEQNFLRYLREAISQITKDDLLAINEDLDSDLHDDLVSMSGVTNLDNTSSMLLLSEDSNEILDIGKAKLVGSEYLKKIVVAKPEDNSDVMLKVKNAIAAFDSIEHMSPEQKSSGKVTAQSNIYSLGFILYRMLTGKKMAGSWGLPSSFGCHKDWDDIILKCLKRDVMYRYQSINELISDIESVGERKHHAKIISTILGIIAIPLIIITFYNCTRDSNPFDFNSVAQEARIERIKEDRTASTNTPKQKVTTKPKAELITLDVSVQPPGGYLAIYKGETIVREIGVIPDKGTSFHILSGEYTFYAGGTGFKSIRKNFNITRGNSTVKIDLVPDDDASKRKFVKAESLDFPIFGKVWKTTLPNIEFVPIEPGKFNMGVAMVDLTQSSNESPVHRVKLTHKFWISTVEITQQVYKQVLNMSPSFHYIVGQDAPVESVTWNDAVLFCKRLTKHQRAKGKVPDGYEYRLPTEAEWEYCCRAGTETKYSFSNPVDIYKYAWFDINSDDKVHCVGLKEPNAWGIYDMHGNVWEWCLDASYDYTSNSQIDPVVIKGSKRIIRGGAFNTSRILVTSTSRNAVIEDFKNSSLGFRIVLAPIIKLKP